MLLYTNIGGNTQHANFKTIQSMISPLGSTSDTIASEIGVDIVKKVATLSSYLNIQYIYSVTNVGTTHYSEVGADSYIWGDSNNPTPQVSLSQNIPFLAGSTGRWVAVNKNSFNGVATLTFGVTWVYLGKNVTSFIGVPNNTYFKYVHYVSGVTSIGAYTFSSSNATGILSLPSGLTSLGNNCFYNCHNLVGSLVLPNTLTTYGSVIFYGCSGFSGNLTIPNTVTSMGTYTFGYCTGLSGNLIIPNSVTSMGGDTFEGCTGFNGTLTISNNLTTLSDYTFYGCINLTGSLTLPSGLTSIGVGTFYNCHSLTGSLTLPSGLTSIGSTCFQNCYGLTGSLTLPNGITTLANHIFYNCYGFNGSLTLPSGLTSIGNFTFSNCTNLSNGLTIPNTVTSIGNYTFAYCTSLTGNLIIPNSVTTLGSDTFEGCTGFNGTLSLSSGITTFGDYTFYGCVNLTGSLTLPSGLTSMGTGTFYNCHGFTGDLTIPSKVTTIGSNCFQGCYGFNGTLTLPNSLTSIGTNGFYNLGNITRLNSYAITAPTLGSLVFYSVPSVNILHTISGSSGYDTGGWEYFTTRYSKYGYLYNWYVTQGTGNSSLIPLAMVSLGWGIQTGTAIDVLVNNIGGYSGVGGKLKEIGFSHWNSPNTGAIDSVNFRALPNGFRLSNGTFSSINVQSYQLCTDQSGVNSYKYRFDYSANNYVEQFSDKKEGAGLRLFRPASVLEQTFPDGTYCDDYIGNDGQFYQTVKIGTQVWLAQNLAETKYRDGSTISTVTDNTAWSNLTTSAKCSYNNDENNVYLFATARQDIFSPNFTTSMSFVSPSGSTTSTLTTEMGVNIVQKTALLYDYSNIQYIYTVTNTNTTHAAQSGADSYIWGDSNNTYPQVSLTNSIPFLSGSTNRWVAYTKSTFNGSVIIPLGATWVYVGKNTTSISSAISNTTLKYIIKDTKSNFTTLGSFSFMGSNLTGLLSLPYNLTSIGDSAFNGCSNLVGSLNIPSSVTTIGNSTFANCYGFIGTLTLPNSLTSIGSSAFSNCHSFTGNLTIPNSVSTLGNSAFENCYGFNGTLTLPSGITYIGAYVFNSCSSFTGSVTIPSSVTSIGYASFNSCYGFNGTLTIPSSVTTISDYAFSNSYGFTGNLTIPSGVTYIGNYSFNNCYGFTGSLTIPSGTTTLNNNTFNMCYGLNGILYLHSGITSIGITTFNGCTNLTGVYSYNLTAPTLGFHAFTGVPKTNTLTIYGSSTGYQAGGWEEFTPQNYFPHPNFQSAISFVSPSGSTTTSIATEMGVNITNIINSVGVSTAQYIYSVTTTGTAHTATPGADSYTFGSSLDATTTQVSNNITFTAGSTGRFVIFNHSNMVGANAKVILPVGCRWVYLGKNVTNSGNNQVVTGIKYIHYAGSSFKVDDYGFMFKSETTLTGNVTFPNYITQIGSITGYGLFDGCTNISGTITIPNSVVTMYGYEFRNCINITGLVLSSSLTSIGPNSFEGCTGLNTSITIPNGVTSIGSECFKNSWVTGLVLPNSYTNIGPNYPLIYMIKLNNITLGNAVTNIGYLGIYGCPLLPSITLPSTISTLGQYALSDCTTLMEIICNAVTPPSIASSNTLSGIPATCSIKVPASSVAAYQAAAFWSSRAAYITGI